MGERRDEPNGLGFMVVADRYGNDILSANPHQRAQRTVPVVEAQRGLVVECRTSGFCGEVIRVEKDIEGLTVELEDRHGKRRVFPMKPGAFLIDGNATTLVRPAGAVPAPAPKWSSSGSVYVQRAPARVARASRIWVEGTHDAELVEKIWGHDLRLEGVVVEPLHGADHLLAALNVFGPEDQRRVGVLLDHLVPNSKESRIADAALATFEPFVAVVGHPYVDVWQAVKPAAVGVAAWPVIPMGVPWKQGVIDALGWKLSERDAWQRILGCVNSYADLEPSMLGRVEELIDFVTA